MRAFCLFGIVLFAGCGFTPVKTPVETKTEAPMPKEVIKCHCTYCSCMSKMPESEEFFECHCTEKKCKDKKCNCNKWKKN